MKAGTHWIGGAAVLISSLAPEARAHHSANASFDLSSEIELVGEVVEWNYRNPHSLLIIDGVEIVDGARQSDDTFRWEVEASSAVGLQRRGIHADTFMPGDRVTVKGHRHREPGLHRALAMGSGTFAVDGIEIRAAPSASQATVVNSQSGVRALTGVWGPPTLEPPLPDTPLALTAAGRTAWQSYDQKLSPANTCEPMSIPDLFNAPYLIGIEIGDDHAIVRNEIYDVARTVRFEVAPEPADPDGRFGTIRGRVDGDALVMESRDYPASRWGLASAVQFMGSGADVPSSDQKTVIERFSVSADGKVLTYEFTVDDPIYLEEPFSHRIEYPRLPSDARIAEYNCEVNSASQFSRD